jgi:myo-inositol-1-phosphate synthase
MIRVHVFCEGQTEETFVRDVLMEHFARRGIWLNAILVMTGSSSKGGLVSFGKVHRQIVRKCKEDQSSFVTTLFDYYGLPKDFPAFEVKENAQYSISQKVQHLEKAFTEAVECQNFIPNFLVHEFEALLFTNTDAFLDYFSAEQVKQLERQKSLYESPEDINDSPSTAPSKRIRQICPSYQKVIHGPLIAIDTGIDEIRKTCFRFHQWLIKLEDLT